MCGINAVSHIPVQFDLDALKLLTPWLTSSTAAEAAAQLRLPNGDVGPVVVQCRLSSVTYEPTLHQKRRAQTTAAALRHGNCELAATPPSRP